MKKRILMVLTAGMLMFGMAGCGENQIPELTDDQMQRMGEFTAVTLMRYDANHRSRLVDYSLLMTTPEPEMEPEPLETQKPAGMDPVDDTPVIGGDNSAGASASVEETLGLPAGINVTYIGHALYNNYPEGEEAFTITATEGNKLLVLSFSVSNTTGQDQLVDLLHIRPEFRVTVNGDYTRRALMTLLENDLSSYAGTITAGESTTVVLVIDVDGETAENIASITLNLKNDSNSCTIQLI